MDGEFLALFWDCVGRRVVATILSSRFVLCSFANSFVVCTLKGE
jgi:hypothetical protein